MVQYLHFRILKFPLNWAMYGENWNHDGWWDDYGMTILMIISLWYWGFMGLPWGNQASWAFNGLVALFIPNQAWTEADLVPWGVSSWVVSWKFDLRLNGLVWEKKTRIENMVFFKKQIQGVSNFPFNQYGNSQDENASTVQKKCEGNWMKLTWRPKQNGGFAKVILCVHGDVRTKASFGAGSW